MKLTRALNQKLCNRRVCFHFSAKGDISENAVKVDVLGRIYGRDSAEKEKNDLRGTTVSYNSVVIHLSKNEEKNCLHIT